MVQVVHQVDFVSHSLFVCRVRRIHELRNERVSGGLLHATVNHAESAARGSKKQPCRFQVSFGKTYICL